MESLKDFLNWTLGFANNLWAFLYQCQDADLKQFEQAHPTDHRQ